MNNMKLTTNKILEAINQGIKFALDDFEDQDGIQGQTNSKVKYKGGTKEWLDFINSTVDLGLPSKTLWCKYNLGVDSNKLSKSKNWYGDYYAWGELEPNKTNENGEIYFGLHNYKWYNKLTDTVFKYNKHDNLIKLLPEDDAAYQFKNYHNLKFHIPTKEQCEELINYTKGYWINNYDPDKTNHNPKDDGGIQGLNGTLFISKINNVELFIPDAGYYFNDENYYGHNKDIYTIGRKIYDSIFWAAYPNLSYYNLAWAYSFYVIDDILYGGSTTKNRWAGLPIRPVINL